MKDCERCKELGFTQPADRVIDGISYCQECALDYEDSQLAQDEIDRHYGFNVRAD